MLAWVIRSTRLGTYRPFRCTGSRPQREAATWEGNRPPHGGVDHAAGLHGQAPGGLAATCQREQVPLSAGKIANC